jgi:hypothetical protein
MADRRTGEHVVELAGAAQGVRDDAQCQRVARDLSKMLAKECGGAGDLPADGGGHDLAVVALPAGEGAHHPSRCGLPAQGPEVDGGERKGGVGLDRPAQGATRVIGWMRLVLSEAVPAGGHRGRREGASMPVVRFHAASLE